MGHYCLSFLKIIICKVYLPSVSTRPEMCLIFLTFRVKPFFVVLDDKCHTLLCSVKNILACESIWRVFTLKMKKKIPLLSGFCLYYHFCLRSLPTDIME